MPFSDRIASAQSIETISADLSFYIRTREKKLSNFEKLPLELRNHPRGIHLERNKITETKKIKALKKKKNPIVRLATQVERHSHRERN